MSKIVQKSSDFSAACSTGELAKHEIGQYVVPNKKRFPVELAGDNHKKASQQKKGKKHGKGRKTDNFPSSTSETFSAKKDFQECFEQFDVLKK